MPQHHFDLAALGAPAIRTAISRRRVATEYDRTAAISTVSERGCAKALAVNLRERIARLGRDRHRPYSLYDASRRFSFRSRTIVNRSSLTDKVASASELQWRLPW